MKRLLKGINPWLPVFAFTTAFHITRGSVGDALIFGLTTALLIADWKKLIPWSMPERPRVSVWVLTAAVLFSAAVLFFSDRNGWQDKVLLLAIAPIAISLVYYRDHGPKPSATRVMARTKWIWMTLALCMAVSELFAYIFAAVYKDDSTYPTISVLVNPILDQAWGRAVFLVAWLLIGLGLLQVRRTK
jgi:hypothetical protein